MLTKDRDLEDVKHALALLRKVWNSHSEELEKHTPFDRLTPEDDPDCNALGNSVAILSDQFEGTKRI